MMQHHPRFRRAFFLAGIAGPGLAATAVVAFADSVPESIRIQERAEKAYESAPVVPIDRGNAHHRDSSKDDEQGGGDQYVPQSTEPPPAKSEQHGSNSK